MFKKLIIKLLYFKYRYLILPHFEKNMKILKINKYFFASVTQVVNIVSQ
jgi:hypothetical protein